MKIIEMPLEKIKPYENNPRKNDEAVEYVANSIREFGFQNPIIVDKNNVIIAGHTRLLAAQRLGLMGAPVIIADDLTPKQVKALRLADNKTAEMSEWDFDLLDIELSDIDFDMSEFGFDMFDPTDVDEKQEKEIKFDNSDNKKQVIQCPNCGLEIEL